MIYTEFVETSSETEYPTTLRVTDRGLDKYREYVRFIPETLPQSAVIVNVGGGENQTFESELAIVRPDVKIITLDPSIHSKESVHQQGPDIFRKLSESEVRTRIESLPNKNRTIDAYGQDIPLRAESVDAILDVHAASQWASSLESYKRFLTESMRVLKIGGKLYIDNVYFGDPIPGDEASEISAIKEARNVFDSLNMEADIFLSVEGTDTVNGVRVPDRRVCAIVTKY